MYHKANYLMLDFRDTILLRYKMLVLIVYCRLSSDMLSLDSAGEVYKSMTGLETTVESERETNVNRLRSDDHNTAETELAPDWLTAFHTEPLLVQSTSAGARNITIVLPLKEGRGRSADNSV